MDRSSQRVRVKRVDPMVQSVEVLEGLAGLMWLNALHALAALLFDISEIDACSLHRF